VELEKELVDKLAVLEAKRPVDTAYEVVTACPWCQEPMEERVRIGG
jgi:hypothetical protein